MVYKECIVPICKNNTNNNPTKLYLSIPKDEKRRRNWEKAINVDRLSTHRKYAVCEDHFILSDDCANWMFFKTMGSKIVLKPEVIPHRNIFSPADKPLPTQFPDSARERKTRLLSQLASSSNIPETQPINHIKEELFSEPEIPIPLTSNFILEENCPSSDCFLISNEQISFRKITVRSIGVQVNIKKHFRSIKTNTELNKTKTVSTMTNEESHHLHLPNKKRKRSKN